MNPAPRPCCGGSKPGADPGHAAPARPVAIVDIGSNSVRLVVYERLSRAPVPVFNEKVLCGLGRGVASTGLLAADATERALAALRTFRLLCRNLGVQDVRALATAAARDARNGPAFLDAAAAAVGAPIELIDGAREAELSALGVLSGFHRPDGVVGDMGGGSLELIALRDDRLGRGVSLPLGGLALLDASRGSPKRAARIARDALAGAAPVGDMAGRTFFAVGGTWRALARLHMRARGYGLDVMHGYAMTPGEVAGLPALAERLEGEGGPAAAAVAAARRPLLAYGAAALDELVRLGRPREVVISATGVREGLLFERLDAEARAEDPLAAAAREGNALRSRDPRHGPELCAWTDALYAAAGFAEEAGDGRLRRAACLMADVAWRAHPDHRAEAAMSAISAGAFTGCDHAGRAFMALAVAFRHGGGEAEAGARLRALLPPARLERARLLGAALRVAYRLSAAVGGVLPRTAILCPRGKLILSLPADLADLAGERCIGRLRGLARLLGREAELRVG